MSEVILIACPPANQTERRLLGILEFEPAPGSIEVNCEKCGQDILIGPKQREVQMNGGGIALCFVCAIRAGGADAQVKSAGGQGAKYKTTFGDFQ